MARQRRLTSAARFRKDFNSSKREDFLQQIRNGMQRGAACDAVFGENNPTRRRLLRDYIEGEDDFRDEVEDAEIEATEHVREALYQAAVSGHVGAAKTWLELTGGVEFPEHRGRPPKPKSPDEPEPFGDLDNVTLLDPRSRRRPHDT